MMPQLFPVRALDAVFANNYAAGRSNDTRVHQGIDIGVVRDGHRRTGDIILSTTPGTVVTVHRETSRGEPRSGNSVTVRDPDGWMHHYAHMLTEPFVTRGQVIVAGTPLGRVGDTGNARRTAAHLHYQIEYRGRRINPYPALAAGYAAMRTGVRDPAQLGDGTGPVTTDVTASPDEREAARELARRLEPELERLIRVFESWPQRAVWDALLRISDGDEARASRLMMDASLPLAHAELRLAHRLMGETKWLEALSHLRTSATLLGSAIAPLLRARAQLPDAVRATVDTAFAFAEFFSPGSTTMYQVPVATPTGNAMREGLDDAREAAPAFGAGAIAALAMLAAVMWMR